jgi:hypothetical protein
MTKIKDVKLLIKIGIFLLVMGIIFSVAWSIQDGKVNVTPILISGGFYAFMWFMAWILRNNP